MFNIISPINLLSSFIERFKISAQETKTNKIRFDEMLTEVLVENDILQKYPKVRRLYDIVNIDRFYTDYGLLKLILSDTINKAFQEASVSHSDPEVLIRINSEGIRCSISVIVNNHLISSSEYFKATACNKGNKFSSKELRKIKGRAFKLSNHSCGSTAYRIMLPDLYAIRNDKIMKPSFAIMGA